MTKNDLSGIYAITPNDLEERVLLTRVTEILESGIKLLQYRDKFRPFAPAVLEKEIKNYFEKYQESIFMEKTLKIKKEKQSLIPAVTHADGTGRLQTVQKKNN